MRPKDELSPHPYPRLYLLAALLVPFLVPLLQPNSLFTLDQYVDPWFYLGYFQNAADFKRTIAPDVYYGTRLSWILPGATLYSLLPPIAANCLLHLAVHLTATASLFTVARLTLGARTALLSTLFFGLHPWLWAATGWDYLDGAGVAYFLAATALFAVAAHARRERAWLFAAGVALAAAVYSNLFWTTLAPAATAAYLVLARWRRRTPLLRATLTGTLWSGLGAALLTILLALYNYRLENRFWFYGESLRIASQLMKVNPWHRGVLIAKDGYGPLLHAHLWLPLLALAVAIAGAVLWLRRRGWSNDVGGGLLLGQFFYLLTVMSYFQFLTGNAVLALFYYASYLLPFVFLTFAATLWQGLDGLSERRFLLLCGLVVAGSACIWADPLGTTLPLWPKGIVITAALAAALVAVSLRWHRQTPGIALACLAVLALTSTARRPLPAVRDSARARFDRIAHLNRRIDHFRQHSLIRFWYDEKEPLATEYIALSSTFMWGWALHGAHFPADGCSTETPPGMTLVVLSRRDDVERAATGKLDDCWKAAAQHARVLAVEPVAGYRAVVLRTEEDASRIVPMHAVFDGPDLARLQPATPGDNSPALPPDRWAPLSDATFTRAASGYALQTVGAQWGYSFQYPAMEASADGVYRFTLHYDQAEGGFAFGARPDGADREWLGAVRTSGPPRRTGEMTFRVRLTAGHRFRLMIANNSPSPRPARLLLRRIDVVHARPAAD